jgi:hypothetical protein
MQEQHKAMLIALRDGRYDTETSDAGPPQATAVAPAPPPAPRRLDVDALERAVRAKLASSPTFGMKVRAPKRAREPARPSVLVEGRPGTPKEPARASLKPAAPGKTIDDVIRSYLDEEVER